MKTLASRTRTTIPSLSNSSIRSNAKQASLATSVCVKCAKSRRKRTLMRKILARMRVDEITMSLISKTTEFRHLPQKDSRKEISQTKAT